MTSHGKRAQLLAALLAALAGYVDATGFIASGGFFVSFMSGNSTRMGIGIGQGLDGIGLIAGLIGAFLVGVILGALAGRAAGRRQRPCVLALVAALLAGGAAVGAVGAVRPAILLMAMAMGLENNAFARNGEVTLGVTYMTGSLVKLGQAIAATLMGRGQSGWLPHLLLWLSFVAGVVVGAAAYPNAGLSGLWAAAIFAGVLALAAWRDDDRPPSGARRHPLP